MRHSGTGVLDDEFQADQAFSSNAHYLIGLGLLGLEESDQAQAEFTRAADYDIYNLWAKVMSAPVD